MAPASDAVTRAQTLTRRHREPCGRARCLLARQDGVCLTSGCHVAQVVVLLLGKVMQLQATARAPTAKLHPRAVRSARSHLHCS